MVEVIGTILFLAMLFLIIFIALCIPFVLTALILDINPRPISNRINKWIAAKFGD